MPKISAKFDRGHPLLGRQMQVEWVKIGDFYFVDLENFANFATVSRR